MKILPVSTRMFLCPSLFSKTRKEALGLKLKTCYTGLGNGLKSFLVYIAFGLMPFVAKADTPIPTSVVSDYDPVLQKLTLTVKWIWGSTANQKHVGAAVFADLNGDGITPTIFDNPATYTSGGNPFPAGLQARDEFLGQLAASTIEGSAFSSLFAGSDNTDNGIASGVSGITTTSARLLFPYVGNSIAVVNSSTGTFTLTYSNVPVSPTKLCVVLYDPHTPFNATGNHSVTSAGSGHNGDNSIEDGNSQGTVPCNSLVVLSCAINKTEAACQSQAAINASYAAWLASVTASGCNGVLTNNSTGAPSASGGSKTVTFTYTQSSCSNQASITTCTATFTVPSCTPCTGKVTSLYFNKLDGGTDIPITNGSSFTSAQLGSLYNMEAGTTGTVGSVKYTISGPTATSNIENTTPYNSPATGSGAWTGAPGSYSVNLKTYSSSNAGGTLCHDTTITFTLTNDCVCPSNVLTNGSFENSSSGWSVSGGTLTFGQSYVMCGSYNGFLNHSSGTAKLWQDVTVSAGSVLSFKGYAGTHSAGLSCSPKLSLIFYNSSNAVISQADANVTYNVGSGNQLALYTINATAPANTVKVRVQASITCNTLKVDGFCLTVTPGTPNCVNSNETFPNQFNTGFNVNLNSTFTGSIGTWSATSNAGATIVVTTPYYSPSTSHAIKIVNWKTNGTNNGFTGTGTATATSPTVNLSTGVCCPSTLQMVFTLWTYTCTSGDSKASVALQFYNGTSWATVWTKTSGELFSTYGANGKTNITVAIPAAYQNSSFKYRFTGASTTGNANNFYLFIDDVKISSTPCPTAALGDFVWQDNNKNGIQDAGEPGIPNVTVTLKDAGNNTIGTTTTSATGAYSFTGLVPGTYSVTFTTPAGYTPTGENSGSDDTKDSDAGAGGVVSGIILAAGDNNTTIDAGYIKLVNLSGNVWHDVNAMSDNEVNDTRNTITPAGSPIPTALRAYLVNASTGLIERVTIVNATTGTYSFTNIISNTNYFVYLSSIAVGVGNPPPATTLPSGWSHTGQKNANPPNTPTGSDGVNDGRVPVPVGTTDVININFGIKVTSGDVVIG